MNSVADGLLLCISSTIAILQLFYVRYHTEPWFPLRPREEAKVDDLLGGGGASARGIDMEPGRESGIGTGSMF